MILFIKHILLPSYKATYKASFTPINIENLSNDSDCEACNIQSRQGRRPKKRKHINRSQPSKRANTCSICQKNGHIKRSPLCSRYRPEPFFHMRPSIGIKVWKSTISATEPPTEPATEPATEKSVNEAWAIYQAGPKYRDSDSDSNSRIDSNINSTYKHPLNRLAIYS